MLDEPGDRKCRHPTWRQSQKPGDAKHKTLPADERQISDVDCRDTLFRASKKPMASKGKIFALDFDPEARCDVAVNGSCERIPVNSLHIPWLISKSLCSCGFPAGIFSAGKKLPDKFPAHGI